MTTFNPNNDLIGTEFADWIDGRGAIAQFIAGCGGNDTIYAGNGDQVEEHAGNGLIHLFGTNILVNAGDGMDRVFDRVGGNRINGEGGNDIIDATLAAKSNVIDGGEGNDTIYGTKAGDVLKGGGGNDDIWSKGGNDTMRGGTGDDTLRGGAGNENSDGGDGNDTLTGGVGSDTLTGGNGRDRLDGGDFQIDYLKGGADNDIISGGARDVIDGGTGVDTFVLDLTGGSGTVKAVNVETLNLRLLGPGVQVTNLGGGDYRISQGNAFDITVDGNGTINRILVEGNDHYVPPPPLQSSAFEPMMSHGDYMFA